MRPEAEASGYLKARARARAKQKQKQKQKQKTIQGSFASLEDDGILGDA
jgi:cytidylate kinase